MADGTPAIRKVPPDGKMRPAVTGRDPENGRPILLWRVRSE